MVSGQDVATLVRDVTIAVLVFLLFSFLFARLEPVPRSVTIITWFIACAGLIGARITYRGFLDGSIPTLRGGLSRELVPILAYGATTETEAFLKTIEGVAKRQFRVVGIIDNDRMRQDRRIRGIKVLGRLGDLRSIVSHLGATDIRPESLVVTSQDIPRTMLRSIVDSAGDAGLKTVRVPNPHDLLDNKTTSSDLKPFALTELLGRDPVAIDLAEIGSLLQGRTILVTGGGGSIGSELCRQIMQRQPARLIVLDNCEFNLFRIEQELRKTGHGQIVQPVLLSVCDRKRLDVLFERERPDLVFHAAACKHVPLVEANPIAGIATNFVGTANIAEVAAAAGTTAVIMISTDKAVAPSNVMGMSKRAAETYCQAMDRATTNVATRFITVRFGNVLGSSGSVVPTFEQQIREGGPITVTHPDMTRYFMTIPEAVQLVLQASVFEIGSSAARGSILVLDMGEPVRIIDLAERMVRMAGLVPGQDIEILFSGTRPGERLHESLFDVSEQRLPTSIPGVLQATSHPIDIDIVKRVARSVAQACEEGDETLALLEVQSLLNMVLQRPLQESFVQAAAS